MNPLGECDATLVALNVERAAALPPPAEIILRNAHAST
jgi:hypothetical protein